MRARVLGGLMLMAALTARADAALGPGDPFGGAFTGCVPATASELACSVAAARAFAKLEGKVRKCRELEARARFTTVVTGAVRTFDEDA